MKYKLVCFDLDGTLIDDTEYIWLTIYDYLGVQEEARKYAKKFRSGEITYEEWCKNDLRLLTENKMNLTDLKKISENLKVMKGANETLSELRKKGYKLAVISGSIETMVDILFPNRPFDYVFINKLKFDKDGYIAGLIPTKYDEKEKATGLKKIAELEKIPLSECVFIGDNKNDIHVAKIAGLGISFNSKSVELDKVCRAVIKEKDLRLALKYITGEEI